MSEKRKDRMKKAKSNVGFVPFNLRAKYWRESQLQCCDQCGCKLSGQKGMHGRWCKAFFRFCSFTCAMGYFKSNYDPRDYTKSDIEKANTQLLRDWWVFGMFEDQIYSEWFSMVCSELNKRKVAPWKKGAGE